MKGSAVCAVDVGSSFIKAAVYDADLALVGHAHRAFPADRDGTRAEADLDAVWAAFTRTVLEAVTKAPVDATTLVLSTQMAGLVLLDESWRPVFRCILGLDERGLSATRSAWRTGCPATGIYPAGKLAWFTSHEPGSLTSVRHTGGLKEYLLHRLTGAWVTDPSSASATGLYDIRARRWWHDAIHAAGVHPTYLARVAGPGDVVGEITSDAASHTGITPGTAVLTGLGDGPAANLAGGAIGPQRLCLTLGTTLVVRLLVPDPHPPRCDLPLFTQHVNADWYCVGVRLEPGGSRGSYKLGQGSSAHIDLADVPDVLRPLLAHYGVNELRPVGGGYRDESRLHWLADTWGLPVRSTGANDGTLGLTLLANTAKWTNCLEAAQRLPVLAEIRR